MSESRTKIKDAATQTSSTNTMLEIARLQEQVRLLMIEIEHLRKYVIEEPPSTSKATTPTTPTTPNNVDRTPRHTRSIHKKLQTPNTNENNKISIRGCNCKGTCSSKICGCVKKDILCGESCKCKNAVCKNQVHKDMDQNKENLENIEHLENATESKSMFSPDVVKDNTNLNVGVPSLYFDSPKQLTFGSDKEEEKEKKERTVKIVNSKTNKKVRKTKKDVIERCNETDTEIDEKIKEIDKRANNYMKNIENGMISLRHGQKGSKQASVNKTKKTNIISDSDSNEETSPISEKEVSQGEINNSSKSFQQKETFDINQTLAENEDSNDVLHPMKPKHELSRTPIHGSSVSRDNSDISLSMCVTLTEDDRQLAEEFSQAEVDWEEYQSQLVACAKCGRKFHPLRIKKHESCCIKV